MKDFLHIDIENEKVQLIINSGFEEFAKLGYDKASTNEIVKNAGISRGLLYHYFRNKKELHEFLIEFSAKMLITDFIENFTWEPDIFDRAQYFCLEVQHILRPYPHMLNFMKSEIAYYPEHYIKRSMEFGATYVFDKIDHSKFKDQTNIEYAIKTIHWSIESFGDSYFKQNNDFSDSSFERFKPELQLYTDYLRNLFYN